MRAVLDGCRCSEGRRRWAALRPWIDDVPHDEAGSAPASEAAGGAQQNQQASHVDMSLGREPGGAGAAAVEDRRAEPSYGSSRASGHDGRAGRRFAGDQGRRDGERWDEAWAPDAVAQLQRLDGLVEAASPASSDAGSARFAGARADWDDSSRSVGPGGRSTGESSLSRAFDTDDDEEIISMMNKHVSGLARPPLRRRDDPRIAAPARERRAAEPAGEVSVALLQRLRGEIAANRDRAAAPQQTPRGHRASATAVDDAGSDEDSIAEPEVSFLNPAPAQQLPPLPSSAHAQMYRGFRLFPPKRTT
jgi:hypothetical protein